jgi:hypothetical protein
VRRSAIKILVFAFVSGATLLQTPACVQVAAETVAGATSSILSAYTRSVVNDWLNVGTGSLFGLVT